jgi:ribosomal subunit interface protein
MTRTPQIVIQTKDVTLDERARDAIERRCQHLAEEFPELLRIEIHVEPDGVGFAVHGHATGKNTDVATHASATEAAPATDMVLEKIARQLRRNHDKRIFSQRRDAQKDPPKRRV